MYAIDFGIYLFRQNSPLEIKKCGLPKVSNNEKTGSEGEGRVRVRLIIIIIMMIIMIIIQLARFGAGCYIKVALSYHQPPQHRFVSS